MNADTPSIARSSRKGNTTLSHKPPANTPPVSSETTLDQWRRRYERLGLATIPLKPHSKEPLCDGWPEMPPGAQWRQASAGGSFRGNIGLLAGNGYAFADGDSPETVINLTRFFQGLGRGPSELVTVISASGNQHKWLRVDGIPPDARNFYRLAPEIGPGELRIGRGAQVVAPCSETERGRYRFAPGHTPETLPKQAPIHWRDLAGLISRPAKQSATVPASPIPLPYDEQLAPWVGQLLRRLAALPPGVPSKRPRATLAGTWLLSDGEPEFITYATRSEAEQAVIAHCVVQGWTLAHIRDLFEATAPGHYASLHPRARRAYLETSYRNAVSYVSDTEQRATLAGWYRAAEHAAAAGMGGGTDYLVYRALLQRGWRASTLEPNASIRDLALAASASTRTVQKSLSRLAKKNLIKRLPRGPHTPLWHANAYRLAGLDQPPAAPPPVSVLDALPGGSELWTHDKLGRVAGLVYARLNVTPLTVTELATATHKHRNSVRAALRRLERDGLAERVRGGWIVGSNSPAAVAREWGAPARKFARALVVTTERDLHRLVLATRAARKGDRTND